jgi:hypothetical protein
MPTAIEFKGAEEPEGAHRLTIFGEGAPGAWASALAALEGRIRDHRFWSAWMRWSWLDFVGAEHGEGRLVAYLAGSIDEWRALGSVGVPAVEAAARALGRHGGRLSRVSCETAPLRPAGYEQITGSAPWPWRVDGAPVEVRSLRPVGAVSPVQLQILATALLGGVHVHADRYDEGPSVAAVAGDRVRLAEPVPRSHCLQLTHSWQQVCWVALDAVEIA